MIKTLKWLWAVYRFRRVSRQKELLFSLRLSLMAEARPLINGGRIAYPDAFFFITPADISRAEQHVHRLRKMADAA